jgi:hypothetical protein
MSLKHRIRRIQDKFNAAVKTNGEELPWPDLVHEFIAPLLDANGKHIYGGQRREPMAATITFGEQIARYDRQARESWKEFQARAFASTPRGRFTRVFTPVRCETEGA